jgi:hypothetical protein
VVREEDVFGRVRVHDGHFSLPRHARVEPPVLCVWAVGRGSIKPGDRRV